jgi:Rieske Fe-S protein
MADRYAAPAGSLAEIKPRHGGVVRLDGKLCAVYRDDTGVPHAVSATCTHLGCVVGFNDAERTWDCPGVEEHRNENRR